MVDPSSDPHRLVPQGWWLYQADRVLTSPVGGGVLSLTITVPAGQVMRITQIACYGPLTNTTLVVVALNEDGVTTSYLTNIAAGASRIWYGPTISGAASTTAVAAQSEGMYFGPGQSIRITAAASAVGETLRVCVSLLQSTNTEPDWATTGSAAGVVLGASTISVANTMQKVDLPW